MWWKEEGEDMEEAGKEGGVNAEVSLKRPRMKYRILQNGIPGGARDGTRRNELRSK